MSKSSKLVLLMHGARLPNSTRRPTVAYVAKLPARSELGSKPDPALNVELSALSFSRTYSLRPEVGKEAFSYGELAYDLENTELVFAYCGLRNTLDLANVQGNFLIRLWRIGPYLQLESVEDTNLLTSQPSTRSASVMPWTNLYVGGMLPDGRGGSKPFFSSKSDNTWVQKQIRTTSDLGDTIFGAFVRSPPNSSYIYFASAGLNTSPYKDAIHLYSMRSARFTQIVPKSDSLWTEYKVVIPDFALDRPFTTHVLYNANTDQYRMYIFVTGRYRVETGAVNTQGAVAFCYVTLLKDGSIANANNGVVTCLGWTKINLPSATSGQDPRIVEWDGKILILVRGDTDFHVLMGAIGKDASLPAPTDWKTIKANFTTPIELAESCFGGAAVVPPKFVDDAGL